MRVKRGTVKKQKHKKVLNQAKGYRLTKSKLYRRAKEQLLHSGSYSYAHRKKRGSDKRRLWIVRINAALTGSDLNYSGFIKKLKDKKILLDRKVLADIALNEPEVFNKIVQEVK